MKTQILKLEIHDDLFSIRDKLAGQQTGRILLQFPQKRDGGLHKRLNRRLDLLLLNRTAERLGAQIAFLTQNQTISHTAVEIGIPVYQDLHQAHAQHWRVTAKHKKPAINQAPQYSRYDLERLHEGFRKRPSTIIWRRKFTLNKDQKNVGGVSFVCVFFLVMCIAWFCTIPHTFIHLPLKNEIQEFTVQLDARPDIVTEQISGVIPSRRFSIIVEATDQRRVTNKKLFPWKKAGGQVSLTNLTTRSIRIPSGTEVSSSMNPDIKFLTKYDVQLESGSVDKNQPPSSVPVMAEAAFPGSLYNLPAESIDTVLGILNPNVAITNLEPMIGGAEESFPYHTMQDKQKLRERMMHQLEERALKELYNAVKSHEERISGFLLADKPEIIRIFKEKYLPEDENIPSDYLILTLQVEYQAWGVSGEDLASNIKKISAANLPEGYVLVENELDIKPIMPFHEKKTMEGNYDLLINVRQQIHKDIQQQTIHPQLVFRTTQKAAQIIKDRLLLDQLPTIEVSPDWLPIMPPLSGQYIFSTE